MLKKLTRSAFGQVVLSRLIAWTIRAVSASIRWQVLHPENRDRVIDELAPVIGIFWHSRIMLMTEIWPRQLPIHLLQSPHPDGQMIARAIQSFGFKTIWGSRTRGKGGAAGLRAMVKALKGGESVGITPDGPRGPRMRLGAGVIAAAQMSGRPIVPGAWAVEHAKTLRTWDRFVLARPFSRGVLIWGEPIWVPRELDEDAAEVWRLKVEDALTAITAEADAHFGIAPTEPEPLTPPPKTIGAPT